MDSGENGGLRDHGGDRRARGLPRMGQQLGDAIHRVIGQPGDDTADTGLRLDRYFGLSDGWWVRLQLDCDLRRAQREFGARIAREVKSREFAPA